MIDFSVVIPAYNEARRLPQYLPVLLPYLDALGIPYEIVVVDDGSRDQTRAVVANFAAVNPRISLIAYSPNRGRGFAIRTGVAAARGNIILITDADGSVSCEAIGRFLTHLKGHSAIGAVFGSRELPDSLIVKSQPQLRRFLGVGFFYGARMILRVPGTTDFTLGFKMFRRACAEDVFSHQWDNQYVAEAEIVYSAYIRGWRATELPVIWTAHRDSRVRPLRDSLRALKGMFLVLARILRGWYHSC